MLVQTDDPLSLCVSQNGVPAEYFVNNKCRVS